MVNEWAFSHFPLLPKNHKPFTLILFVKAIILYAHKTLLSVSRNHCHWEKSFDEKEALRHKCFLKGAGVFSPLRAVKGRCCCLWEQRIVGLRVKGLVVLARPTGAELRRGGRSLPQSSLHVQRVELPPLRQGLTTKHLTSQPDSNQTTHETHQTAPFQTTWQLLIPLTKVDKIN